MKVGSPPAASQSPTASLSVRDVRDLASLRRMRQCQTLNIDFWDFSKGNLPLYAARYAVWALAPEGIATITAMGSLPTTGIFAFRWTFRMVVQIVARAIDPEGRIIEVNHDRQVIRFQRVAPAAVPQPWSSIVMFSGSDQELPALQLCVQSIAQQEGIQQGGELIVCGPTAARRLAAGVCDARYLAYDDDLDAGRIMIARKKNFAISAARHENVSVCHTRMVLRPDTLARLPDEFDCITPRVVHRSSSGSQLPYLDLGFIGLSGAPMFTCSMRPRLNFERDQWQRFLASQYAYVDGGLFCVKRAVALETRLHDALAWGEGEDVEWCVRLQVAARLTELAEDSVAESQVNRLGRYERHGHRPGFAAMSQTLNVLQHGHAAIRSLFHKWGR